MAFISVIILPVLPDQTYEVVMPFNVLNPFRIWLLVGLVSEISFVGYVLTKGSFSPVERSLFAEASGDQGPKLGPRWFEGVVRTHLTPLRDPREIVRMRSRRVLLRRRRSRPVGIVEGQPAGVPTSIWIASESASSNSPGCHVV